MNLQELHNDHRALQAQAADVEERYQAKKLEYTKACEALLEQWFQANDELVQERETIIAKAGEVETTLRDAIKAAYAADPSKKTVAPGLSVRVTKRAVYDKAAALEWAKAHGLALALDAKAFEKIADVQPIDFVTFEDSVSAVIGK
jgi:hypothetical protein